MFTLVNFHPSKLLLTYNPANKICQPFGARWIYRAGFAAWDYSSAHEQPGNKLLYLCTE
jgi:hypothetical protein